MSFVNVRMRQRDVLDSGTSREQMPCSSGRGTSPGSGRAKTISLTTNGGRRFFSAFGYSLSVLKKPTGARRLTLAADLWHLVWKCTRSVFLIHPIQPECVRSKYTIYFKKAIYTLMNLSVCFKKYIITKTINIDFSENYIAKVYIYKNVS